MSYVPEESWRLLYDLDFTAEPTLGALGNGVHPIDGKSWTVENAGAAAAFSQTNGVGLVITPLAGGANYGDGARSAPLIRTSLGGLVGDVDFSMTRAYRLLCRVLLADANENFEFAKAGFEYAQSPANYSAVHCRGFSSGVGQVGTQGQLTVAGVSARTFVSATANDVLDVRFRPDFTLGCFSGLYSGGWPPNSSIDLDGSLSGSVGSNVIAAAGPQELRVVLVAQPTGSATQFTATFTNIALYERV